MGRYRSRLRGVLCSLVLFLSAWVVLPSVLANDEEEDRFTSVRAKIQKIMVEESIPSIAVAVVQDGEILWEEGLGWADRENRIPATKHTVYGLASISKTLTATGLMVLVERGEVDLDRPINDYLGDVSLQGLGGDAAGATVRRVASHTAGLPTHWQTFYEDESYPMTLMDELIRRYGILVYEPGEWYQYSNLGYTALGYVVERVSGESLEFFLRKEVFLPLGMIHTAMQIGREDILPGLEKHQTQRYSQDGLPYPFLADANPGGGDIYSSAHDLVRFGMFHLKNHLPDQKAILSDATLEAMQKPVAEGIPHGIGWELDDNLLGFRTVNYNGGMDGVSTYLTLVPEQNVVVVVLVNEDTWGNPQGIRKVRQLLLQSLELGVSWDVKKKEPRSDVAFPPGADWVGEWRGSVHTYEGEESLRLWVKESGEVQVQLGSQFRTLLDQVRYRDGFLEGKMMGVLDTDDLHWEKANGRPYFLELEIRLREQRLMGQLTAETFPANPRDGVALPHWIELEKE